MSPLRIATFFVFIFALSSLVRAQEQPSRPQQRANPQSEAVAPAAANLHVSDEDIAYRNRGRESVAVVREKSEKEKAAEKARKTDPNDPFAPSLIDLELKSKAKENAAKDRDNSGANLTSATKKDDAASSAKEDAKKKTESPALNLDGSVSTSPLPSASPAASVAPSPKQ